MILMRLNFFKVCMPLRSDYVVAIVVVVVVFVKLKNLEVIFLNLLVF